ncbi:DUF2637 domain-containing protein [Actinomadura sp. NPDC048955]|uniref:DUF2637 domain-containing protein n=1 Tax=Actinomadura sp. NPDC048955 TaxID=3158228 RepID=UPI0033C5997B
MRRLAGAVADSAPVVVLAGIAAAGSFTHIRDTATEHGQRGWMAWAIAHRPHLRHGRRRTPTRQEHRTRHRTADVAHRGPGRRNLAVARRQPGPS